MFTSECSNGDAIGTKPRSGFICSACVRCGSGLAACRHIGASRWCTARIGNLSSPFKEIFVSVGLRLKEERKRIGLTQTELAERCGLTKRAQVNFEKEEGEQLPGGAYLLAATTLGIDVLYVLTGERNGISTDEAQVLSAYRVASPEIKLAVSAALGAAVKASGRHKFVMHANEVGQALSGDISQPGLTINLGGKKAKKKSS